jgi:MinD superfamily P-loop ATPase
MKISIASGKGGTGKTMVTASLATIWPRPIAAVDLDVEEPNLHLFLKPSISDQWAAFMEVPKVDESQCDFCRQCSELCRFKAISVLNTVVMVFSEMCHGCGGCIAVCPKKAITSDQRILGEISLGTFQTKGFLMGRLRVGESMSPPLIKKVLEELARQKLFTEKADILIDAPPGVSCPAVSAVIDSDVIVLVTEPTPFGLFDLRLALQAFTPLNKPMGVVINRAGIGNNAIYRFCEKVQLPVLAEIPYQRSIAEAYSKGLVVTQNSKKMGNLFLQLTEAVFRLATSELTVQHA